MTRLVCVGRGDGSGGTAVPLCKLSAVFSLFTFYIFLSPTLFLTFLFFRLRFLSHFHFLCFLFYLFFPPSYFSLSIPFFFYPSFLSLLFLFLSFFPFTSFSLFQSQCFLSNQSRGANETKYMTFPFHTFIHSHQKSVPFALISTLLTVPFVASAREQNGKTITNYYISKLSQITRFPHAPISELFRTLYNPKPFHFQTNPRLSHLTRPNAEESRADSTNNSSIPNTLRTEAATGQ